MNEKCHCCGAPVIDLNHRAGTVGQIYALLCPDCFNAGAYYDVTANSLGYILVCPAHPKKEAPAPC